MIRPLLCAALACAALCARAGSGDAVHQNFHYTTVQVAPGITTFLEDAPHAMVDGNTTLIVGKDAALVIDSGHYPAVARRVIAEIKQLTDKPVRYLAITHWHMDHYMANAEYVEAWPGLSIVAHEFTAGMMDKEGPRYIGYGPKLDKNIADLQAMLDSGKAPDGKDIAPDRRQRIQVVVDELKDGKQEFGLMRYRGADMTFTHGIDIDLGGRTVKLMNLGRGNTAGDLVAWVPDVKVLVTGDTVVHPIPFSYGSYLGEWPAVLQKMADLKPAIVVPGHGPVMHDTAYLEQARALLLAVMAEVKRVWKPGMSGDDVRKAMDISKQRDIFCKHDRTAEANFDNSIGQAGVDRAVQELEGKMKPEGFEE